MANTIQIKHGAGAPGATTLAANELGFDTTNNVLYIGKGSSVLRLAPFDGGTITGTVILSKVQDASGTADNKPALIVGGASTAQHIEIDGNEILSKTNGTTPGILYLQDSTGEVRVAGSGGLSVTNGGLAVSGGNLSVSAGALNVTAGSIWAGTDGNTTAERQVGVQSGAGRIYLYSVASTTGYRGIYVSAHGTGAAKGVIAVDTNNNVTFYGSLDGTANQANYASALNDRTTIGSSSTTHATALKAYFDANKASIPRNKIINFYDQSNGNGSVDFGYWLNGYNDNPYGGFFVAHYGNAYYVGIQNGNYTLQHILTDTNYGSHNHDGTYLKLTGGSLSGDLKLTAGNIEVNAGKVYAGTTSSTTECWVEARCNGSRILIDATSSQRGVWADGAGWIFYAAKGTNVFTIKGNIDQLYYGSSAPSSPRTGQIWLKPI